MLTIANTNAGGEWNLVAQSKTVSPSPVRQFVDLSVSVNPLSVHIVVLSPLATLCGARKHFTNIMPIIIKWSLHSLIIARFSVTGLRLRLHFQPENWNFWVLNYISRPEGGSLGILPPEVENFSQKISPFSDRKLRIFSTQKVFYLPAVGC